MKLSLIVAIADNRVIGKKGSLPWHLPEDLRYFKKKTMGAPIIMGRKTFDSIGHPLKGRQNIIISRNSSLTYDNVYVVTSFDASIQKAKIVASRNKSNEAFVIGGAQIYALALEHVDRLYITEVHTQAEGDSWFPQFNKADWVETNRKQARAIQPNQPKFSFVILEKKKQTSS